MSDSVDAIYDADITREVISQMGKDAEIQSSLSALDIDYEDHDTLSDVLDPDQGGSIAVIELIEGIERLRGEPRRSDMVTLDLMLRSVQRVLTDIHMQVVPDASRWLHVVQQGNADGDEDVTTLL